MSKSSRPPMSRFSSRAWPQCTPVRARRRRPSQSEDCPPREEPASLPLLDFLWASAAIAITSRSGIRQQHAAPIGGRPSKPNNVSTVCGQHSGAARIPLISRAGRTSPPGSRDAVLRNAGLHIRASGRIPRNVALLRHSRYASHTDSGVPSESAGMGCAFTPNRGRLERSASRPRAHRARQPETASSARAPVDRPAAVRPRHP